MASNFGSILKSEPFVSDEFEDEVRVLIAKFNHHHDNMGRFSTAELSTSSSRGASDSWKGGANVTRGSRYGKDTASARSAMMGGAGRKAMGKTVSELHSKLSPQKRHGASVAVFSHKDSEGNKKFQSVYMSTHEAEGKRTALDRSTKNTPSESKMADLMAGQEHGHSVTHFESHAKGVSADQKASHLRLQFAPKEFKNLEAGQKALEQAGLDKTLLTKTKNGWELHAPLGNNTPAGRAMKSKLVQFRRMHVPSAPVDHWHGTKTVTNKVEGKKQIENFVKAHPTHALSQHWLSKHPATATA